MGLVTKSFIAWILINAAALIGFWMYSKAKRMIKRYNYARVYSGQGMRIIFGRRG